MDFLNQDMDTCIYTAAFEANGNAPPSSTTAITLDQYKQACGPYLTEFITVCARLIP